MYPPVDHHGDAQYEAWQLVDGPYGGEIIVFHRTTTAYVVPVPKEMLQDSKISEWCKYCRGKNEQMIFVGKGVDELEVALMYLHRPRKQS